MGKFFRELTAEHQSFIRRQHLFFVATAPSDDGRINLSPKGYDTLVIDGPNRIAYLDYAGSGNETANHVGDGGRITFMWCSFDDKPLILRVYGYGRNIDRGRPDYDRWMQRCFPSIDPNSARRVIVTDIEAIQTSCGFGVPLFSYDGERPNMAEWTARQLAQNSLDQYIEKNAPRNEVKFPLNANRAAAAKE